MRKCTKAYIAYQAYKGGVMLLASKNLKWTICLGGLLAPWLLTSGSVPAVAAGLTLDTTVTLPLLPNGKQAVLRSFDISFVNGNSQGNDNGQGNSHTYALAASGLSCTPNPMPPLSSPRCSRLRPNGNRD